MRTQDLIEKINRVDRIFAQFLQFLDSFWFLSEFIQIKHDFYLSTVEEDKF